MTSLRIKNGVLFAAIVAFLACGTAHCGFVHTDEGMSQTEGRVLTQSYDPENIILKWKEGVVQPAVEDIAALGIEFVKDLSADIGIKLYKVTDGSEVADKVAALNSDPRIEYAEVDGIATIQGTGFSLGGFDDPMGGSDGAV